MVLRKPMHLSIEQNSEFPQFALPQTQALKHQTSRLCLAIDGQKAVMQVCNGSPSQVWEWAHHFTPKPSRVIKNLI